MDANNAELTPVIARFFVGGSLPLGSKPRAAGLSAHPLSGVIAYLYLGESAGWNSGGHPRNAPADSTAFALTSVRQGALFICRPSPPNQKASSEPKNVLRTKKQGA